ncbi:MAG: amino acid permease [Candidatus Omnitrophota bacterium]
MEEKTAAPKKGFIGVFVLAMLNVAVICTLRGLPVMAKEGLALVFYYAVAAIFFLIPVSLVTAELATGWPPKGPGGVYVWVKEAFGPRWGFLAIWLQWIENVIWYPTALSFLAATLAYIYDPSLASNKLYLIMVILVAYWGGHVRELSRDENIRSHKHHRGYWRRFYPRHFYHRSWCYLASYG